MKNRIKAMPLATKIFIFSIIIMLSSILIFSVAGGYAFRQIVTKQAKASTMKEVDLLNNSMELLIRNSNDTIVKISLDNRVLDILSIASKSEDLRMSILQLQVSLSKVVNEAIGISHNIIGCDFVTATGQVVHTSSFQNKQVEELVKELDGKYKNSSKNNQELQWISSVSMTNLAGERQALFIVRKPIYHLYTTQYLGDVIMYVDEDAFSNLYSGDFSSTENHFYMMNDQGEIISAREDQKIGTTLRNILHMDNDTWITLRKEGEEVFNVNKREPYYVAIREISGSTWYLATAVSMHSLLHGFSQFIHFLLYFGIIYIVLAFFIAKYMSDNISKPIKDLKDVMKGIKSGKRNLRAKEMVSGEMYLLNTTFNNLMDENDHLISAIYKKQEAIRRYEFLLMQAQIKPHFLYNTLGTIHSLIQLEMKNEAINATQSLATFYRLSLSQGKDFISAIEEVNMVEHYLSIQRYRYINNLDYNIAIQEEIEGIKVPKLTLQPIVENAIYHGIKPKCGKGLIYIRGYRQEECVIFDVVDTGIGIEAKTLEEFQNKLRENQEENSFGLRSIQQRIKLLYGIDYGITLTSCEGHYTKVSVKLPYKVTRKGEEVC